MKHIAHCLSGFILGACLSFSSHAINLFKDSQKEIMETYSRAAYIAARGGACDQPDVFQHTLDALLNYAENENIKKRFGRDFLEDRMDYFMYKFVTDKIAIQQLIKERQAAKSSLCNLSIFVNSDVILACVTYDECIH